MPIACSDLFDSACEGVCEEYGGLFLVQRVSPDHQLQFLRLSARLLDKPCKTGRIYVAPTAVSAVNRFMSFSSIRFALPKTLRNAVMIAACSSLTW
ncbi:MAG: hypothetical protein WB699_06185 [Bacteroidota bacterium]